MPSERWISGRPGRNSRKNFKKYAPSGWHSENVNKIKRTCS
jgi:hypothetical protein